jgi:predicted nucleotidyltransferase
MAALIAVLTEEIERVGVATVAKRAGVSRQHLYKILAGTSHPTSENLEALSHAVSCNVAILRSKYYPADPQKEKALDGLVELIKDLYDPQEVWIFGSQARGDWSPKSDIDLMVVGRKMGGPKRGEVYVQATKRKIRVGFDAVFVTKDDFEKHHKDEKSVCGIAVKEGRIIYSRRDAP